jgi:hypothetical protein
MVPHHTHHMAKPTHDLGSTELSLETLLRQDHTDSQHHRREDVVTAMGEAHTGSSNIDEEANPLRSCSITTTMTSVEGNLVICSTRGQHPQHC